MEELIINLHNHSVFSDGTARIEAIGAAALHAGLDAVMITDHNVLIQGFDRYIQEGNKKVLVMMGEEIHDQTRQPQKSHLLVFGANQELSQFAEHPQKLIEQVNRLNGVSFLAHPHESAMPFFGEKAINWEDWQVKGFTGLEIWNGLSELKSVARNFLEGVFYIFFPTFLAHGPNPETLRKWDELLSKGQKVVAVGGADAHALKVRRGPIKKVVYPYSYHYQAINNHVLLAKKLTGRVDEDKILLREALRAGHSFVGYDLPHPTRGFRFTAQGRDVQAIMGDEIALQRSVTLQIRLPIPAECRLIRDGQVIQYWERNSFCTHIATDPGVYRVECFVNFMGKKRGWIFSNPIYVIT